MRDQPRRWIFAPDHPARVAEISRACGIPEVLARLLVNRGLSAAEVCNFLTPSIEGLHDPYRLHGMSEAVPRIRRAIAAGEKIAVFGDFDVDGSLSTALLMLLFRLLDADAVYHIPRRLQEGYGLNHEAILRMKQQGVSLLITVDNGITAVAEAHQARSHGMDVIITDHHEPGEHLPEAVAVLNPKLDCCTYPEANLAGVGVAFKLAWALAQSYSGERAFGGDFHCFLETAIGLAGLATITDVVPLIGENRVFAAYGLEALPRSANPGVRALLDICNLTNMPLDATHIAYRLGPRLNAGGRLGNEDLGVRLMLAQSYAEALDLAQEMETENKNRQTIEREITARARQKVLDEIDLDHTSVIVLADDDFHPGVVGIVASRLAEEFWRPAIVITFRGPTGRGSARSIPGFSIYDALSRCDDMLLSFGGHRFAAGLEIHRDDLPRLRERLNEVAGQQISPVELSPQLSLDAELTPSQLAPKLVRDLAKLAPHGEGNPLPLFATPPVELVGRPRVVGRNYQHLCFAVRDPQKPDGPAVHAIAYNRAEDFGMLTSNGNRFRLAYSPRLNNRCPSYVELVVRDIHTA